MQNLNLKNAFDLIKNNPQYADFEGPKSDALIKKAEDKLQVSFPQSYRSFLKELGCGNIGGQEFYGLISENFENSGIPDAIWVTLFQRKAANLPDKFVIVGSNGRGGYYVIEGSKEHTGSESPVFLWVPGIPKFEENFKVIAEDFGQFIFNTIRESLLAE